MSEERRPSVPADGPARGEPGSGEDLGRSSQDQPAEGGEGVAGRPAKPTMSPDPAADTNERADERAHVVEPDGEDSPRA